MPWTRLLTQKCLSFQGPLTGRITTIAPFLNFNAVEQAVIAHKFILRLASELRPPVSFRESQLIGSIDLKVGVHSADGDGPVCALLAQQGYNSDLGARSLEQIIDRLVRNPLFDEALQGDEVVDDEEEKGPLILYSIDHRSTGEQDQEAITVRRVVSDESGGEW